MSGEDIARLAFEVDAVRLRPNKPFVWASGYQMPIYLDNRILLSYHKNRQAVAKELKRIIEENNISCDLFGGIPNGGITPAATLSQLTGIPMVVRHGDNFYELSKLPELDHKDSEVIASACPIGMVGAIELANELGLQYIFVREKKKGHGREQQIEGVLEEGQTVYLIDRYLDETYYENTIKAIEKAGGIVVGSYSQEIVDEPISIEGRTVLPIEDHISLGGSSVDEVIKYRDAGATITNLLSNSNYDFPKAVKNFEDAGIIVNSVYNYDNVLSIAKELGKFDSKQESMLREWSSDPFNWGEKYAKRVEK